MMTTVKQQPGIQPQQSTHFVVAVLLPHKSSAMEHYVERIAACLHVLLPQAITVKTVDTLSFKRDKNAFHALMASQEYDFYLCIGAIPGELYCAASTAGYTNKPGMILSDQEHPEVFVPANVMNSCLPNNGEVLYETLLSLLPDTKKILLCASRYSLEKAADLQTIRHTLARYHIPVQEACITTDALWKKAFVGHDPYTTVAITSFEPKMFQQVGEVAAHARKNKVFSFATNVYAIHEGVDFAFGYSETKVFRRVSEKIVTCLQQGMLKSETMLLPPSLHCNVEHTGKHKKLRNRLEQLVFAPKGPIRVHLHANQEARR